MAAPAAAILLASMADETVAAEVTGSYLRLLADRNALPAHPALHYGGSIVAAGSNALKVPIIGIDGYDAMTTGTEGDPVGNTGLTDSSVTVTVVQKTLVREPSDIAKMIDKQGFLRPEQLAMDGLIAGSNIFRYMVANVTDDFTGFVGTTTIDAAFADFLDAITALEVAKVEGPYLGLVHPQQWGDVRKDVASVSGGAIVFNAGVQALIDAMKGLGYKGSWLGVDWFTTTDCPDANAAADKAGGVFGLGGVCWCDGLVTVEDPSNQAVLAGQVLYERQRVVAGGTTKYASHRYIGVSKANDSAGVSIITDAP